MNLRCFVLFLMLSALLPLSGLTQELPLVVRVSTDKWVYDPGETVRLQFTMCNQSEQVVQITTGMCCLASGYRFYIIDENDQVIAEWDSDDLCAAVPCTTTWEPSACRTGPQGATTWDQSVGYFPRSSSTDMVPPGFYRARVSWLVGPWQMDSRPFEIRAVAQPLRVPTLSAVGIFCFGLSILTLGIEHIRRR